jgi:hypothetical protein
VNSKKEEQKKKSAQKMELLTMMIPLLTPLLVQKFFRNDSSAQGNLKPLCNPFSFAADRLRSPPTQHSPRSYGIARVV